MSATPAPRREIDKSRWPELSPLLDELLDLEEPAARAARLAQLRAQDLALAEDLEELLARDAAMARAPVLDSPVLAQLAQLPTLKPGQQLGPYALEREIGQGGMGTVWLARRTDGRYEGQVAVKFLTSGLLGRGDSGRFAREGQILGRLAHPHIARLLDAGVAQDAGPPYLVLEYIDGQPIDRFCEQQALDVRARVTLFLDVLAAVAHAHNRLILHRDLKPSNILVNQAGEVKLLDFGIAKLLGDATQPAAATELTQQAGRAFTLQYAAPEQVQGGDVTTATDVYALGMLLYLLLSGQHPTAGAIANDDSPLARMKAVLDVEPRRLSEQARSTLDARRARELRGDLDTIVARALKKAPAERYANAEAMAADLKHWLAHEPIQARPDSAGYRIAKFVRRHRIGVAAGTLAGLAVATGAGVALWKAREAHQQRVQAESLIEFMLGDLRKKLEPVGRLDVLDAVGEKALDYYAQQDLGRTDADSLGRRSRALHLMGEVALKQRKFEPAAQLFAQAADSTGELLGRDPDNPQRIFDHAQSLYWLGDIAWQRRHMDAARTQFDAYLNLANRLHGMDPANPKWRQEQAFARWNIGVLLVRGGQPRQGLDALLEAKADWVALMRQDASVANDLIRTLGWLAEAQEVLGQFTNALQTNQEKLAAIRGLPELDRHRESQQLLHATQVAMSRLYLSVGRPDEAVDAAKQAWDGYRSLAALDSSNVEASENLALAGLQLAEVWLATGHGGPARALAQELSASVLQLRQASGPMPARRSTLAARWLTLRVQLSNDAELAAQRNALSQFLQERSPLAADSKQLWAFASAELALGDAFVRGAAPGDAALHWERAYKISRQMVDPDGNAEPRVNCLTAHALLRLGRPQEARPFAENALSASYLHPMSLWLRERLQLAAAPP